ncbi:MAG TPA: LLM class flavin-dependent oxidoreductase [Candidatus Sulfotelmatobacter sp.]
MKIENSEPPSSNTWDRRTLLKSVGAMAAASTLTCGPESYAQTTSPSDSARTSDKSRNDKAGIDFWRKGLVGIQLAHEQFTVPQLLELGIAAERAGFDLITASDHFQPWQSNEAHAGLAWVTMSAIGQRTSRIGMGTTVTCPTFRYNPAVVAEAFASMSLLNPGRIFLGLGSGEALNEEAPLAPGLNGRNAQSVWSRLLKLFASSGPANRFRTRASITRSMRNSMTLRQNVFRC